MDWTEVFREHILARGLDYHMRGLVEVKRRSPHSAKAEVKGSQIYNVEIKFDEGEVISIYCDCPHAAEGNYCKHTAAVLFTLDRDIVPFVEETDVEKLVDEASEETVRDFLVEILEEDNSLLPRFERKVDPNVPKKEPFVYRKIIDEIFYVNSDSSGFIDYYKALDLETDLEIFLKNDIEDTLMRDHAYEDAFELTSKIFVELSNQEIDDSGGITTHIIYYILEIWENILAHGDQELKEQMFRWFTSQLNGGLIDYMEENLEDMLFENFMETEFLEEKLVFSREKFEQSKTADSEWMRKYAGEKWAIKHLETLALLNREKASEEFIEENLEYPQVREFYVDQLLSRNDDEKAIQLLEGASEELSREYRIKLKKLYKKENNETAYRKLLWDLVIDRRSIDFEHYFEYKNLYTEAEWAEKRSAIIRELFDVWGVDQILAEEGLYDLLLEYVVKQHNLQHLQAHEDVLVKLYPDQVFDRYEQEIMTLSEISGPRKKYRKIVLIIRQMQALPNSGERVKKIVANLKTAYANRPTMIDELSKL